MQGIVLMAVVLGASGLKSVGVTFGPKNCVSLSRSSAGSCVLSTECEGIDISAVEFAFDCIAQSGSGDIVRHSFGIGGFEVNEEFDTEVKCGRCSHPLPAGEKPKVETVLKKVVPPPAAVKVVQKPAPVKVAPAPVEQPKAKHEESIPGAVVFRAQAGVKAKGQAKAATTAKMWPFSGSKAEKPDAVKYGPNGCVSTWRSDAGHCMMATDCKGSNISNYEFGLVCVDKSGSPVKHLFGKDSFDAEESFDTLIKCKQCLGLEDVPDQVALAGEVASMAKDITNLKDVLKNISVNVQMLNAKVFPTPPAAPAPAPAPAPAEAPKKALLLHRAVKHHKHHGNLRRSHRHHHRHRDDDDDEDEDDEDDDRRYSRDDDDEDEPEQVQAAPVVPTAPVVQAVQAAPVQVPVEVLAEPVAQKTVPLNEASQTKTDDDDDDADGED